MEWNGFNNILFTSWKDAFFIEEVFILMKMTILSNSFRHIIYIYIYIGVCMFVCVCIYIYTYIMICLCVYVSSLCIILRVTYLNVYYIFGPMLCLIFHFSYIFQPIFFIMANLFLSFLKIDIYYTFIRALY